METSVPAQVPSALVIAHPGHELFVSGWLRQARPRVFVLTDGSGRSSDPRIDTTRQIIESAGARAGSIFGRFSDRSIYEAILNGQSELFVDRAKELAAAFADEGVRCVVGDSYERQCLSHDLCRILIGAAIEMAERSIGDTVVTYEFPMYGYFGSRPREKQGDPIVFQLDATSFEWKLKAARSIPDPSLQREIDQMIEERGQDAFKVEYLFPVDRRWGRHDPESSPPHYEVHGEKLVEQGEYDRAIRYRDHVLPIVDALSDAVGQPP